MATCIASEASKCSKDSGGGCHSCCTKTLCPAEKRRMALSELCNQNSNCSGEACKLSVCSIFRSSNSCDKRHELCPSAVRCCKNICGPLSQSPCGYFYASSIFNKCRFKNTFRPTCLRTGCTNYMAVNPRMRGLGKKISSNTLHTVESVNDLRAWSVCKDDQRRYFMEKMFPSEPSDVSMLMCSLKWEQF